MLNRIIFLIFAITWIQHYSCELIKWIPGPDELMPQSNWTREDYDWLQKRQEFTGLDQSKFAGKPHRLREYMNIYKKSVRDLRDFKCPRHGPFVTPDYELRILQNELITNGIGEYSLNYETDHTHRVETGVFEKSGNAVRFVARGYFHFTDILLTYKLNETGFYTEKYPNFRRGEDYSSLAAKAILCSCCAQHATCSSICGKSVPVHKDCAPAVAADKNTPKVKEQWFRANKNGSYEFRTIFDDNYQGRSEIYEFDGLFDQNIIFGFFPFKQNSRNDLPYYFQPKYTKLFIGFEEFPATDGCPVKHAITPPSDVDYSNINVDVQKSLIG